MPPLHPDDEQRHGPESNGGARNALCEIFAIGADDRKRQSAQLKADATDQRLLGFRTVSVVY